MLGAFGAPLGKSIIKERVASYIINRIFPKQLLKSILKQKLASDFDQSFLESNHSMQNALVTSISILKEVGMVKLGLNESRILKDEISTLKRLTLFESEIIDLSNDLKLQRNIKVSCTSIHPAAISVFKSLSNRLSFYGVDIEIFFEDFNGHYQVLTSKKKDFDFAIFPNDAFFMIENSSETDYRLIFTINGQTQYLFHRKTKLVGKKNQVHIYQDSSAHMHYLLGKGVPKYSENKIIEKIDDFSILIREMAGGDMIIVWEPLASILYNNSDFELIPNSGYRIWNSLFCQKSWNKPSMRKSREAFKALFINEWRTCNANRSMAIDMLLQDEDYLRHFAAGAGISY